MFWIFGRKNPTKEELENREVLMPLYEGGRELHDLVSDSAELRVWLPTTVFVALKDISIVSGKSASQYLREFFGVYLYGAHEIERMRQNSTGIFYDVYKHPADLEALKLKLLAEAKRDAVQTVFSRASYKDVIPGLGKNIVPLKLFISPVMKSDLQSRADVAEVPLSQFVREVLVSHFLGHVVWPERAYAISEDQIALVDQWTQAQSEAFYESHQPVAEGAEIEVIGV